ncbi:MAG: hypothetical protein QMD10_10325 [Desulfitobacteriaceae bacterium]|nr:hypothetical protein [Desulfitobacteriaceae bacterium]
MSAKKYYFNEFADRLIRERYDSRTETIDWLSQNLGFPRWAIKRRAQTLGLARTKEKPWSEKDVAYLESNLHRLSLAVLARKLGRTVTAVALKTKRLGIKKSDEGYTARSLAQAFGVDDHKVVRWVELDLMRASRRNSERPHDMYFIPEREVKRFVCTYPTEFDLKRVDQVWFIDLLAGVRR